MQEIDQVLKNSKSVFDVRKSVPGTIIFFSATETVWPERDIWFMNMTYNLLCIQF